MNATTTRGAFLASQLVDIGEGLAGAFVHLHRDPRPDACETLATRLQGAARHVMHLADELQRERLET